MNIPVPRPPSARARRQILDAKITRALARDARLTVEERAARKEAFPRQLNRKERKQLARMVEFVSMDDTIAQFRTSFQGQGWSVQSRSSKFRGRVEGWTGHDRRCMVLITRNRGTDALTTRLYVVARHPRTEGLAWGRVASSERLAEIMTADDPVLENNELNSARRVCHCPSGKIWYLSCAAAYGDVLASDQRVAEGRMRRVLDGAYRCPYDDKVWHTTSFLSEQAYPPDGLWDYPDPYQDSQRRPSTRARK